MYLFDKLITICSTNQYAKRSRKRAQGSNERSGYIVGHSVFHGSFRFGGAISYSRSVQQDGNMFLPLSVLYLLSMFALFFFFSYCSRRKRLRKKHVDPKDERRGRKNFRHTRQFCCARLCLDWLPGQIGMTISIVRSVACGRQGRRVASLHDS